MAKKIIIGVLITLLSIIIFFITIKCITEFSLYRHIQKQDWLNDKPLQVSAQAITYNNPQLTTEDIDVIFTMLKGLRFYGKNPDVLTGDGDIVKIKYADSEIKYIFGSYDRVWIYKNEKLLGGYYINKNLGVKLFGFLDRITGNYYKWLDYMPQEVIVTTIQGNVILMTDEKQIVTLIRMIKELRAISGVRETLTGPVHKIKLKYEYMEAEYTFPSIDQVWVNVKGSSTEKYHINKEMGKAFFEFFNKVNNK